MKILRRWMQSYTFVVVLVRCKLTLYAADSTFEKDLYHGSREPMHVLGISVL